MEINPKIKKLELEQSILEHELEIIKSNKKILEHQLEISKIRCEINKIDIMTNINTNTLEQDDTDIIVVNEQLPSNTYYKLFSNIKGEYDDYPWDIVNRYELSEKFIRVNFKKYIFDRMLQYNKKCGFKKHEMFLKHNHKQIYSSSTEDYEFILELANKINKSKIKMADSDHCAVWYPNVFYYNKKGEICIMHPR
jgi:hypothetical protein